MTIHIILNIFKVLFQKNLPVVALLKDINTDPVYDIHKEMLLWVKSSLTIVMK